MDVGNREGARRLRILHVVRGLPNSSGTTHIVCPLSEAQARAGHAVSVWSVEKAGQPAVIPAADLVSVRVFRLRSWTGIRVSRFPLDVR